MQVGEKDYRAVWMSGTCVQMIDQNRLPFAFGALECPTSHDTCMAIRQMNVRGAGSIGAAAAFAMAQICAEAHKLSEGSRERYLSLIEEGRQRVEATRPTARDLFHATGLVHQAGVTSADGAVRVAHSLADGYVYRAARIGELGATLIADGCNLLTHCNAGWLALVDHGSALAPIYHAHQQGKRFHVYVDETRPRLQGARLTAWELHQAEVSHTLIADNAAAFLMWQGKIDLVITGADRITANGDTANKIGTFAKAVAARSLGIPFYVAAPSSTIDWQISTGRGIPIEYRDAGEVLFATGPDASGIQHTIRLASPGSGAINPAFDITPAEFITAFITEEGIFAPGELVHAFNPSKQ